MMRRSLTTLSRLLTRRWPLWMMMHPPWFHQDEDEDSHKLIFTTIPTPHVLHASIPSTCFDLWTIYDECDYGYVRTSSCDIMLHTTSCANFVCQIMFETPLAFSYAMHKIAELTSLKPYLIVTMPSPLNWIWFVNMAYMTSFWFMVFAYFVMILPWYLCIIWVIPFICHAMNTYLWTCIDLHVQFLLVLLWVLFLLATTLILLFIRKPP